MSICPILLLYCCTSCVKLLWYKHVRPNGGINSHLPDIHELLQTKFVSVPDAATIAAAAAASAPAPQRAWARPEVAQSSSDSVADAIHAASKTPLVNKRLDQPVAAASLQRPAAEVKQEPPRPETTSANQEPTLSGTLTQVSMSVCFKQACVPIQDVLAFEACSHGHRSNMLAP